VLRGVEPDGGRDLADLPDPPFRPGAALAARWDAAGGRVLVAVSGAGTAGPGDPGGAPPEYWLVRFRPEPEPGSGGGPGPEAAP
jgi:hypothetical protein